jgi:hypothetical protein
MGLSHKLSIGNEGGGEFVGHHRMENKQIQSMR